MSETPQTNEWLIYDLSASLRPIGFRLNNPKLGFFDYKDTQGNEATLSLGVIGGETIYLSGPSVTLKNQTIFNFLHDLHKKGLRNHKGSFFSHRLPQFDDLGNARWAFKFGEDEQNELTLLNLLHYLKENILPLIERWGTYRISGEDVQLLSKETDANYNLVVNLYLGGQRVEAEKLAREYLTKLDDEKDIYEKFIKELFDKQPMLLTVQN